MAQANEKGVAPTTADLEALLRRAPGGRMVVRLEDDTLVVALADEGARLLLGLVDDDPCPLSALLVAEGGHSLAPPPAEVLTASVQGEDERLVDLHFSPAGPGLWTVTIVDVTTEMRARQRDLTRRHYLARLSDLALMFAFSYGIDESGIIEVACSAARRMAGCERAIYYSIDRFSEEGIRAEPRYESRTLRTPLVDHPAVAWEVGNADVDLVDDLAAGAVVRTVDQLPDVLAEGMRARKTREVVMLPVVRADNVGGVVMVESLEERVWLLEELELLQAAMALFGSALDRMVARLDLKRSEAFSGSVVSAIADGILVVDSELSISMANPSARRILGPFLDTDPDTQLRRCDSLIDKTLDADGVPLERALHPIVRALREKENVSAVSVGLDSDEHEGRLWLQMSVQPLSHGGQSGEAAVVCISDMTERRTYEKELLLARDAALDASRLKGAFLANMSHEIRTPMNGILGTSALLLESGLDPRQREYALTLKGAAESLLTILDDVLDLSKIEAGRVDIEKVPFEPLDMVDEVLDLHAGVAQDKGLKLGLHIDDGLCTRALGDPHRLRQVLNNLVGNALKFTDTGRVDVHLRSETRADGAWLCFEVRDTGIGMAPETVERAFDRFMQADVSTTRRFGGTGLGLSITQQLVDLMGGRVGVESTEHVGSTFFFEVPTTILDDAEQARDPLLVGVPVQVAVSDPATASLVLCHLRRWGAQPVLPGDETVQPAVVVVGEESHASLVGKEPCVCLVPPGRVSAELEVDTPPSARELRRALLTASLPSPRRPGEANNQPAAHPGRARVLVVEDQHVNQLVARSMLELLGCEVEIASDGAQAVKQATDEHFDLVFMDCQMPVMDGFEATRRIRTLEAEGRTRVPIVAVSASAMGPERSACAEAGMDDFVAKPVRLEDFEAALHRWAPTPGAIEVETPPPPPQEDAVPLLDEATLIRLRAVQVDAGTDLVGELAQLFIAEGATRLDALSEALAASDRKALKAHAHSLKGSASTLGALRLSSACRALEVVVQDGALALAAEQLAEVQRLYNATSEALRDAH